VLLELAAGSINLTTVVLLAPNLTPENGDAMFAAARHQSKSDVEKLVAALAPQPDIPSSVKTLTAPRLPSVAESLTATDSAAALMPFAQVSLRPSQQPLVAPLAADRHLIRVTVSGAARRKLERAQDLLRHAVPSGNPAEILDRALTLLVEHLEKTRLAAARRPRKDRTNEPAPAHAHTRHIPSAVKRAVWTRDEGRCAFVGANGRCGVTGFLELHHVVPFAVGGKSTRENLELRCRAHNAHEAALYFGNLGTDSAQSPEG
jgi:5-methylcytosine-specific restriction endonuclease McrA